MTTRTHTFGSRSCVFFFVFALLFLPPNLFSQWSNSPSRNTAIAALKGNQYSPQLIADGNGGTIFVWQDARDTATTGLDIYAQKLKIDGTTAWSPATGLSVVKFAKNQRNPILTTDGLGGAIIVWEDFLRSEKARLWAQHLDFNGNKLWGDSGIAVTTLPDTSEQGNARIVSDGGGGAYVVWEEQRDPALLKDIYCQHLTAGSGRAWGENGKLVCGVAGDQTYPAVVRDGFGGIIIVWKDARNSKQALYAQRLNSSGTSQWLPATGDTVCTSSINPGNPVMVTDDAHGAIVAWQDNGGASSAVFAQRLAYSNGGPRWGNSAVGVTAASSVDQTQPVLCPDGRGGAIIAWQNGRSTLADIYANRIDANGSKPWTSGPVHVCDYTADQTQPVILSNGFGGAFVAWYDKRTDSTGVNIYAQQITDSGNVVWKGNSTGLPVCIARGEQAKMVMESSSPGSFVLGWQDFRADTNGFDVYTQNVNSNGTIGFCSITASVFLDLNEDEAWDKTAEPGVKGWAIKLTGAVTRDGVTDSLGECRFEGLLPGSYTVTQTMKPGWRRIAPDFDSYGPFIIDSIGTSVTGKTWAMFQDATISGAVYNDIAFNGRRDSVKNAPVDPGLSGWIVTADNGSKIDTVRTGSDGTYAFYFRTRGRWVVKADKGYRWYKHPTQPDSFVIVADTGKQYPGKDFGRFQGTVAINVFEDIKPDSVLDAEEKKKPTLPGWTLRVYTNGVLDTVGVTDKGAFTFTGLSFGDHIFEEKLRAGWTQTMPRNTEAGFTSSTSGDSAGPKAFKVTIDSSGSAKVFTRIFANSCLPNISGRVIIDRNGDTKLDNDVVPVAGRRLRLYNDRTLIASTNTDSSGSYQFASVPFGTYTVEESLAVNSIETYPAVTDTPQSTPGSIGSKGGPRSYTVGADSSAEVDSGNTFGVYYYGTVRGMVFEDLTGDSLSANDRPLAGWTVTVNGDNNISSTDFTRSDGSFSIDSLPKSTKNGAYSVSVAAPTGWKMTTTVSPFRVDTSTAIINRYFGEMPTRRIYGKVFNDFGRDGRLSTGDKLLDGWTVTITGDTSKISYSLVTGSDGSYSFTSLPADIYSVEITLKSGWRANTVRYDTINLKKYPLPWRQRDFPVFQDRSGTISGILFNDRNTNRIFNVGESAVRNGLIILDSLNAKDSLIAKDSMFTNASGIFSFSVYPGRYRLVQRLPEGWKDNTPDSVYKVTIAAPPKTQFDTGKVFSRFQLARITGVMFKDNNGDGVQGSKTDEPVFVAGNRAAVILTGARIDTAYADDNGRYVFVGLNSGSYSVRPNVLNYGATLPASGKYDMTIYDTADVTGKDFGLLRAGTIAGNVSGQQGGEEFGIPNYRIYIRGVRSKFVDSTLTDSAGNFQFVNLKPDTFRIAQQQVPQWYQISPRAADTSVVLREYQSIAGLQFNNVLAGTISGVVFEDGNADSVKASGEPGLANWRVKISGAGIDSLKVSTDSLGRFRFTHLAPDSFYTISESLQVQAGWVQIPRPSSLTSYTVFLPQGGSIDSLRFGNFAGSITGTLFQDMDGSGSMTADEPGLQRTNAIVVSRMIGSTMIPLPTRYPTTATGTYTITGLTPGTYNVRDSVLDGWERTTGLDTTVTVSVSSVPRVAKSFGQFKKFNLSGHAFIDDNRNGMKEAAESWVTSPGAGIQWRILLYRNSVLLKSTQTDKDLGTYSFTSLGAGTYWIKTQITDPNYDQSFPIAPGFFTLHPVSGTNITDRDFGIYNYNPTERSITLRRFKDRDAVLQTTDDDTTKTWDFYLYQDSVSGAPIATSSNASVLLARDLTVKKKYIAVIPDSSGWLHADIKRNGVSLSRPIRFDTVTIADSSSRFMIDFLGVNPNRITVSAVSDTDGLMATLDRVPLKWTFSVYKNSIAPANLIGSATTADSLVVSGLGDGTYYAVENDSSGWKYIGMTLDRIDSTTKGDTVRTAKIIVTGGMSRTVSFLNTRVGTLLTKNYQDMDGNMATTGDWFLKKWKVRVYRDSVESGIVVDSSVVDSLINRKLVLGNYVVTAVDDTLWNRIGTVVNGTVLDSISAIVRITIAGGDTQRVDYVNFFKRRFKQWVGSTTDSSWTKITNWTPEGYPTNGDSVKIPGTAKSSVTIPSIALTSLVIDSAGKAFVAPGAVVSVENDIILNGFLAAPSSAPSKIVVGGSWVREKGAFEPGTGTVQFLANITKSVTGGTFANVVAGNDSGPMTPEYLITINGKTTVKNSLRLNDRLNIGSDTLSILGGDPDDLSGDGFIIGGTIQRAITPGATGVFQFENKLSHLVFDAADGMPTSATMIAYPGSDPLTFASNWESVGGAVDTANNQVTADGVTNISRWQVFSFGVQRGSQYVPLVNRVYLLSVPHGDPFSARLALRYLESERQENNTPEASLLLLRAQYMPSVTLGSGWQLVSSPLQDSATAKDSLFAGVASHAYSFYPGVGYAERDSLTAGRGYWLKLDTTRSFSVITSPVVIDTIDVHPGWNMIGGPSVGVPTQELTSWPIGIVSIGGPPKVYGFSDSGSYTQVTTIEPYRGYWIKAKDNGKVYMSVARQLLDSRQPQRSARPENILTIRDARGRKATLVLLQGDNISLDAYELPPLPPGGAFDVRFSSNRFAELVPKDAGEFAVTSQNVQYPVTVSWTVNLSGGRTGTLSFGDPKARPVRLAGTGTATINSGADRWSLKLGVEAAIPREYALEQNYPNPFNPSTEIRYALPAPSRVVLKVFNVLGQEVATVINEEQVEGYKLVSWNGQNAAGTTLPSGVYFYRLEAHSTNGAFEPFTQVRKMLLLR